MPEKISEMQANAQFKTDYTRYGIYILYRRVLSDYRDGLKPVQRRIIWAMYKNTKAITSKVKSAAVVGDVMKLYHPHGDSAIYATMKPMANWFETYIPLIDPEGNFGTFQGDPQAASRYTEVKLSKFAIDNVLGDLIESAESGNVDLLFFGKNTEYAATVENMAVVPRVRTDRDSKVTTILAFEIVNMMEA